LGLYFILLFFLDFYSLLKEKKIIYQSGLHHKSDFLQLAIPLVVGGVFVWLNLSWSFVLLAPLYFFYGLALVNAGKYTYSDIQYLGYNYLLGVFLFFLGYGLFFGPLVLEFTYSLRNDYVKKIQIIMGIIDKLKISKVELIRINVCIDGERLDRLYRNESY
jgi:hypothetical protein